MKAAETLTLPSGTVVKNRIAKSAMSETLATMDHHPTQELVNLYDRWAKGGAGILITGNVMIDRSALGEPGNVVIEDDRDLPLLTQWAEAGKQDNTEIWVQLNHPGKQSPNYLSKTPVAPSAIPYKAPLDKFFNPARALTESEIQDLIQRFATAADVCKQAGFTGVQIHGAHGYLVSQFLSPIHNQRTDQWGGSIENRMRFVVEIYNAIRAKVGERFNVGIKMNSADFQRGGFTEEESMQVAEHLSELGMDLIEISGGTYESPKMTGVRVKESTRQREAYFMDYAEKIRQRVKTPLLITGGFRTPEGINAALESGAMDMAGIARTLAIQPEFVKQMLNGEKVESLVRPITTGIKVVDKMALMEISWYAQQLGRIANGKEPITSGSGLFAFVKMLATTAVRGFKTKRMRA